MEMSKNTMEVVYNDRQISLCIPMLDNALEFSPVEFVVDTGFTGTLFFTVNPDWDIFKVFNATNIELLEKKRWVVLADGKKVKTYSAEVVLFINNQNIDFSIRICIGEKMETPLIGMKFLSFLNSRFLLDFETNEYILDFRI